MVLIDCFNSKFFLPTKSVDKFVGNGVPKPLNDGPVKKFTQALNFEANNLSIKTMCCVSIGRNMGLMRQLLKPEVDL